METIIFPLPYTSNITQGRDVVLSSLSDMSMAATNVLLDRFPEAKVVIAGEHTFGSDYPSTGQLMAREIGGTDRRVVMLEDSLPGLNLNNTAFQVEAFNLWLQTLEDFPKIISLGYRFHLPRIEMHMARYGITSGYADIKEVLIKGGIANRYPELDHLGEFEGRERIVRALAFLDRKGSITKQITKRNGAHVHDILVDDLGEPTIVNQSAKARLAELGIFLAPI